MVRLSHGLQRNRLLLQLLQWRLSIWHYLMLLERRLHDEEWYVDGEERHLQQARQNALYEPCGQILDRKERQQTCLKDFKSRIHRNSVERANIPQHSCGVLEKKLALEHLLRLNSKKSPWNVLGPVVCRGSTNPQECEKLWLRFEDTFNFGWI